VKSGGKIKLEPLSVSLVRSVAAVTSQASVTTVTMAPHNGDDGFHPEKSTAIPYIPAQQQAPSSTNIHQERAPRYFSLTKRGHQGHNEGEPDFSPVLPGSPEKAGAPPALPSSSVGHRQQKEVLVEGWRGRQEEEEKAGGREQGGAREDSIQEKLLSSDRDRGDQLQHPKHSAEPSLWRGEQEPQTSRRAADSQEGGEKGRGKGGQLREATAAYSSSKQEQKGSQGGISGLIQSLPKPYPQVAPQSRQAGPQVPPQTPPKPHSFPQALKSQSASADHLEDFSRNSKAGEETEAQMTIEERKQMISTREDAWKSKGKGAANDSTQYTVAARMAWLPPPQLSVPFCHQFPPNSRATRRLSTSHKRVRQTFTSQLLPTIPSKGLQLPRMPTRIEISEDFDSIFGSHGPTLASAMVQHKRSVRPSRNVQASKNPLKMLAAREDIRHEYTEERLNVAQLESKRVKAEKSESRDCSISW
ncbi:hypothetical protein GOODEAATRI_008266, partial [Goodea atripinnis]